MVRNQVFFDGGAGLSGGGDVGPGRSEGDDEEESVEFGRERYTKRLNF